MTNRALCLDLIRELPKGDPEGYRETVARLDEAGWEELALVVGAAFFLAARRKVGVNAGKDAVIGFVADMRAAMSSTGFDLDPIVAERLIASTMDQGSDELDDVSGDTVIETQLFLLTGLLSGLSEGEMAEFLARVDALVEEWATA